MRDPAERIKEALHFIPATSRETWLRIGMAVKSELGDDGFELWDGWSQQADSYNTKDARDVWKSIRAGGRVTAGTLFYEAKANGWQDDGTRRQPTPQRLYERRREAAERDAEDAAQKERVHRQAVGLASTVWRAAQPAQPDHPYLVRKGVAPVDTLREIATDDAAALLVSRSRSHVNAPVGSPCG